MSGANGDNLDCLVGQCCEACGGEGENYCEYADATRTCFECGGTGIVDYESRLEDEPFDCLVPMPDEATQKRLTAFAHECIRNSGGEVLPNNKRSSEASEPADAACSGNKKGEK